MSYRAFTARSGRLPFTTRPDLLLVMFGIPFLAAGAYFFIHLLAALGLIGCHHPSA